MVFKLTSKMKKWITLTGMTLLAASAITTPINLVGYLPDWVLRPILFNLNLINVSAYVVLVGVYWIFSKQID